MLPAIQASQTCKECHRCRTSLLPNSNTSEMEEVFNKHTEANSYKAVEIFSHRSRNRRYMSQLSLMGLSSSRERWSSTIGLSQAGTSKDQATSAEGIVDFEPYLDKVRSQYCDHTSKETQNHCNPRTVNNVSGEAKSNPTGQRCTVDVGLQINRTDSYMQQ